MIKQSSSLYKMPYFNVEYQALRSVDRQKDDYQEIVCIGGNGCNSQYSGYKYTFKYSAEPTIEPLTYKLKGQTQQASLDYNDISVLATTEIMTEVQAKLNTIGNYLEPNILSHQWNDFNNQQLQNKIFQKVKSFVYRGEIYTETGYLNTFVPSITISSEIYIININYSIVNY